ncbi:MAG: CPBP family intramembrane metalloprotease [Verrucomicrobiales bacterium]|nr:CPBP family intramembrane metalloprotease [Verrucomicrobiales bacterium]MCP5557996.1 CPBP family intramembrane metalloprotease [Verrucomicrobiaceae bacterium]
MITTLATVIGFMIYPLLNRLAMPLAEGTLGLVDATKYRAPDVAVAIGLGMLLVYGMFAPEMVKDGAEAVDGGSESESSVGLLLANAVFLLFLCALLLSYITRMRDLNPVELFGLRRLGFGKSLLVAGIALVPTILLVYQIALLFTNYLSGFWPEIGPQETVNLFVNAKSGAEKFLLIATAVLVAPIVEETIFRGFIYGVLKRYTDRWFAMLVSSVIFAVVHLHLGSAVPLFTLAMLFCVVYEITGCLSVTMWMHAMFNGLSMAALLFETSGAK